MGHKCAGAVNVPLLSITGATKFCRSVVVYEYKQTKVSVNDVVEKLLNDPMECGDSGDSEVHSILSCELATVGGKMLPPSKSVIRGTLTQRGWVTCRSNRLLMTF